MQAFQEEDYTKRFDLNLEEALPHCQTLSTKSLSCGCVHGHIRHTDVIFP